MIALFQCTIYRYLSSDPHVGPSQQLARAIQSQSAPQISPLCAGLSESHLFLPVALRVLLLECHL